MTRGPPLLHQTAGARLIVRHHRPVMLALAVGDGADEAVAPDIAAGERHALGLAGREYLDDHSFNNVEIIPADTNLEGLSQPPTVSYRDVTFGRLQKEVNRNVMMQRNMLRNSSIKEAEQKSQMIEYACVMGDVPKDISQEIVEFGVRNIKDEDLYTENNLGRELDSHITIKYGIISDDSKQVEKLFKNIKPFKATLGEVKHFSPEDRLFDVLTVSVESKDLSDMNEKITKEIKCATGLPSDEYHPHITIAYIKKGTCKNLYGNKEFVGKEITIDSVEFSPVKGDKSTIELGNKKEAAYRGNMDCWLASDGKEYSVTRSHTAWIVDEANLLKQQYGLTLPAEGSPEDDNLIAWLLSKGWTRVSGVLPTELDLLIQDINNIPQAAEQFVWKYKPEMVIVEDLQRNDTSFDREEYSKGMMKTAALNLVDLGKLYGTDISIQVPEDLLDNYLNSIKAFDRVTTKTPEKDFQLRDQQRAESHDELLEFILGSIEGLENLPKTSLVNLRNLVLSHIDSFTQDVLTKKAEFLPSLFPAPDNHWTPDSDKEIALNPDSVSDDETLYGEWWQDRPRNKDAWRAFISMFKQPLSKKENMTVEAGEAEEWDSHYGDIWKINDKVKLKNSDQLGIIKEINGNEIVTDSFKTTTDNIVSVDQSTFDYPHNTQWFQTYQDGEPSKVTPVTYSPESNEDNLDQNGPDGMPWRFMRRPKGEWFTDEGAIVPALQNMWKNREASLDLPPQRPIPEKGTYPAVVTDDGGIYFDTDFSHETHFQMIDELGIPPSRIVSSGWLINGIYDADNLSNIMPYVEQQKIKTNREAAINSLTRDITSAIKLTDKAYWVEPNGQFHTVRESSEGLWPRTHSEWGMENLEQLKKTYPDLNTKDPYTSLLRHGWIRIGDSFDADYGIQTDNPQNLPSSVIDWVNDNLKGSVRVDSKDASAIVKLPVDDLQEAINNEFKLQKLAPIAKQAIRKQYALYIGGHRLAIRTLTYAKALKIIQEKFPEYFKNGDYEIKQEEFRKEAGSYSASVPDYQGEQYYNEQHMNDTDCEPYVNHDQRDTSWGYHDSPENTMSGISWPETENRYTVYLDQIQNPADRNFPPGMMDYETINYYLSAPMSDSLEATNPD